MSKVADAKKILQLLGMPPKQFNDRSAMTFLALLGLKENDSWSTATNLSYRIVDIMAFIRENYGKDYKPNSRETFRKETIHQFVEGAICERNTDDENRATNSPNYSYKVTNETLELIQSFDTNFWEIKLQSYLEQHNQLVEKYAQKREMVLVPVKINGEELTFSPGKHSQLQKAIIELFAPRFAPNSEVLYVGDTADKDLVKKTDKLLALGLRITDNDKLPDVVLYCEEKNWLYFVEAVTSVGPVSVKRISEIKDMLENCNCGLIFVTAFLDMSSKNGFKKFIEEIAWETEVWFANNPDHMIHLNGDRFIGPR